MPYKVLDDLNSDGVVLGQNATTAKVGMYGGPAIPQRSNPMQANIQGLGGAMMSTVSFTFTPVAVNSYTCVEQYYAITPTLGLFCETSGAGDFLLAVNKPTVNAGAGIAGVRISATNQIAINFANATGAIVTPTQPEVYTAIIAHGVPIITQAITPLAVASLSTSEQIFTIQGSGAAGTAIINASGQVVGVNITAGGSGYSYPPAIILGGGVPEAGMVTAMPGSGPNSVGIIGGSPFSPTVAAGASDVSGTFVGLNYPAATSMYPYGSGATAIAVVNAGAVIGAVITAPGSGYQAAPSVTFLGGNLFSPGMMAHVNKPSATTGIGIGNVRVVGPYQVGIEFINNSTATLTPPSESYAFMVTNEFSAVKNVLEYVWTANTPIMGILGVATSTNVGAPVTLVGILSGDYPISASQPSVTGVAIGNTIVSAASLLNVQLIGSQCITMQGGLYWNASIFRRKPLAPSNLLYPYLSFTNPITAAGTWEVSQTITGVPALSQVTVNKPSFTPGIAITNARVSAANTVQLTVQNITSGNISLPQEFYTVEVFNTPAPGAGSNALSYVVQAINPTLNQIVDLDNEMRDSLDVFNMIKGA